MQNTKINKIRTVLAVLLLAFSIFSVAVISLEANHECSGDDCPVCFVISVAEQNLKLLTVSAVFAIVTGVFSAYKKQNFTSVIITYLKSNSLISQKIRMND